MKFTATGSRLLNRARSKRTTAGTNIGASVFIVGGESPDRHLRLKPSYPRGCHTRRVPTLKLAVAQETGSLVTQGLAAIRLQPGENLPFPLAHARGSSLERGRPVEAERSPGVFIMGGERYAAHEEISAGNHVGDSGRVRFRNRAARVSERTRSHWPTGLQRANRSPVA
jgi:hypothetical protein